MSVDCSLRGIGQQAQCAINRFGIGEVRREIRFNQNKVAARSCLSVVLASDTTAQPALRSYSGRRWSVGFRFDAFFILFTLSPARRSSTDDSHPSGAFAMRNEEPSLTSMPYGDLAKLLVGVVRVGKSQSHSVGKSLSRLVRTSRRVCARWPKPFVCPTRRSRLPVYSGPAVSWACSRRGTRRFLPLQRWRAGNRPRQ